tara:strand:+ start:11202 stop:11951 length:750 start_codon:yes stop_codon:yes gene_type:complete
MKVLLLLFILLSLNGFSQSNKVPSYFGVHYRTVLPNNFVGSKSVTISQQEFTSTCLQKTGYSIGATVRAGITKLIAFETGINLIHRNFQLNMSVIDSNQYSQRELGFLTYDIPLNCLIYIKLNKSWYANASLGIAASYKPSTIGGVNNTGDNHSFIHTGYVDYKKKFTADFNGNIGFEFRSKKSGFFYLGGSVQIPLAPLFILAGMYKYQGYELVSVTNVNGSFLSLDLKFFFPNTKSNGSTFRPGPIE